jgi:hypothetical protein
MRKPRTRTLTAILFVTVSGTSFIGPNFFTASAVAASSPANMQVPQAVADAVLAAQNLTPVPASTTPSIAGARADQTNLGSCSAFNKARLNEFITSSRICNLGDPHGTKTLVAFGNSHTVMWTRGLEAVAKASHWKFYPVVKQACGYDTYVGLMAGPNNQCAVFYKWGLTVIKNLHPDAIIMGSFTKSPYWREGQSRVISALRPLTARFILFSDTPRMSAPDQCLGTATTQGSCLWPLDPRRAAEAVATKSLAQALHVQYFDITNWFCDQGLCPSVIAGFIPYTDGEHVTPEYAKFLAPSISAALHLNSSLPTITPIASVPLATAGATTYTTTTTTYTATTTTAPGAP